MAIQNYKDLEVWKKGRALVKDAYRITAGFPKNEQYRLVDQLCRSAISIPSNIAEGHARNTTKDYLNFLFISSGSLAEMETQLLLASDLQYISNDNLEPIMQKIHTLQRMLSGLRKSLQNPKSQLQTPKSQND